MMYLCLADAVALLQQQQRHLWVMFSTSGEVFKNVVTSAVNVKTINVVNLESLTYYLVFNKNKSYGIAGLIKKKSASYCHR